MDGIMRNDGVKTALVKYLHDLIEIGRTVRRIKEYELFVFELIQARKSGHVQGMVGWKHQ